MPIYKKNKKYEKSITTKSFIKRFSLMPKDNVVVNKVGDNPECFSLASCSCKVWPSAGRFGSGYKQLFDPPSVAAGSEKGV